MELHVTQRRICAGLSLILILIAPVADAGIGRTPGAASVTPDGEAQYTIPISLPPGTNGMTPELSLEYRHRTRGGLLGVGWSISGLSQITRCARTMAQDGVAAPVLRTTADRFCLDGQRLVNVKDLTYQALDAEYRTEIESFARVKAITGTSTNGPAHFVVEAADGRIYEYGATADSRIDGTPGPSTNGARTWALNRIRDRSGNVIDYRYTEETASNAFRIASIHYNSNPTAGIAASHQVSFSYENRPNSEVDAGFVAGTPVRQVMRLDRIDVRYNDAVIRRYDLDYEPALSSGGRSRLASVKECGAGGTDCLSLTTFEWQEGATGFSAVATLPIQNPTPGSVTPGYSWNLADINGDGRNDYLWVGGTQSTSSTIRYRLSLPGNDFGPAVDSGIPSLAGVGVPFDANGDGRADLLIIASPRNFAIAHGGPAGLGTPVNTGIAVADGTRDYRGADFNGDGLGDIVWSEAADPQYGKLLVRYRRALPGGGFAPPLTLFTQSDAYQEPTGGEFIGLRGQRVDLDGDGAEDLLMNENFSIARVSDAGNGAEQFDSTFAGAALLDFNDDDCTDFAYKHLLSGFLRVRLSGCTIGGSAVELQGPAWTGAAALQAHDWNGDGRDDLLLRGSVNWMVALSRGDSLAPLADTGVPHENALAITGHNLNGDSLQDIVLATSSQMRVRFRAGAVPDLLVAAIDGFDVSAEFDYGALTDAAVHTKGSGAAYPEQDLQAADVVVTKLDTTDGSGRGQTASTGFRYEGLRRDVLGRGSLGFRKVVRTELSGEHPLQTEITLRQDYPFTGLTQSVSVRQVSGKVVSSTEYQWAKLELGTGSKARRFPYASTTTTRSHEAGGPLDGIEISRVVRAVAAIDATSGLITDETITTTESGGGASTGSSASLRKLHSSVLNDTTNWCLGRSQAVQFTASHTMPGGNAISRSADQAWDGLRCRPTRILLLPGDTQWQVNYDLSYDSFGNIANEKITGAGMAPRSVVTNWGPRGQLPILVTNPLSQIIRYTWDESGGRPLTFVDPNGATMRWQYDAFGQLTLETQPDGTATRWFRESCKAGCDQRTKYRIRQNDLESTGATRIEATLEVDQLDRGFRLEAQRPGGGRSVSMTESGDRGQITRHYLPHWDGDLPPGYRQFSYDVLGRLVGDQVVAFGGAIAQAIELQYDGLTVTQTDSLGHPTAGTRNAWGGLTEVVDAKGGRTRYEYDAFGALLRVRDAQNNLVAALGYNPRGMKLTVNDMDRGPWTWTRNALGETTALRDAKGQVIRFEYDPLGRITKRIAPEGNSVWTWGNSATKNDIGRLASVTGPGYSEGFAYDSIGRPASHTIAADSDYRYNFTYNTQGLLNSIVFPAAGAGSPLRIRHEYDAGRVTRIANADSAGEAYWTLNSQDAAGNALDETLGGAVRIVSGFTSTGGDLEYRQAGIGAGTAIQNLAYEWDANGNLKERRDLNQGLLEQFDYDALNRLDRSRKNGAISLELDYDPIGNIRRKSDVCPTTTACYVYHSTRKHAVVSTGSQAYAYDPNGNMTSRGGAAIAWTSDGLPSSIAHSNGNNSQFFYGPAGNRWKQVAKYGAANETTINAAGHFEKVTRGGVTTWRHYVLTPGGVALHLRYSDGTPATTRYLTLDHLGSTDRIVDAAGNVIVAESFGSFGNRRKANWTGVPTAAELAKIASVTRDGFTGHEQLDNLDLVHMNGRVYDPRIGRFISADPFVTLPYDGEGLNRYSCVLNNPLAFTDPSGFDPIPCVAAQSGNCAKVTVIGATWAQYMRAFGGAHSSEIASALERDPCGQNGSALACAMQSGTPFSASIVVLTVGRHPDSTLSTGGRLDGLQGFAARIGNLTISSSPIALLFGADPDFQYFRVPDSSAGQTGALTGNVGYFLGGAIGMVRKGGSELATNGASAIARSFQGTPKYPGVDRFKDITLKKGTVLYSGFPGQTAFYTTASALRRAGDSANRLFGGLQVKMSETRGYRTRIAAYEVLEDTPAAFGLAITNIEYGAGWLPQVVIPSFESTLRRIRDFPIGP